MNTMLEKIKTVLRHNQFIALAAVIVLVLGVWLVGCDSEVTSPITGQKVTRAELIVDHETYLAKLKLAKEDLDKQDLFKQQLFSIGVAMVQGGTVDPIGASVTLLGILGLGAIADNRKKDAIIKTQNNALTAKVGVGTLKADVTVG